MTDLGAKIVKYPFNCLLPLQIELQQDGQHQMNSTAAVMAGVYSLLNTYTQ